MITPQCLAQCSAEVSVSRGTLSGLFQGQDHGIRSGDYHSSARETTAILVSEIMQTTDRQPGRPPSSRHAFSESIDPSGRHSLISSSVGEDRVQGADSVSVQECQCDTEPVLVLSRVSVWHPVETL